MNTRSPKRLRSSTLSPTYSQERPPKRRQPEVSPSRAETSNSPLATTKPNDPAPEPPINLRRSKRNATRGSTLQAPPFKASAPKLPITPISPLADDPFKVPNSPRLKNHEDLVVSTDTPDSSRDPSKNNDSNLPSPSNTTKLHNSNDQNNQGSSIYSHTKLPHALAVPAIRVTAPSCIIQEHQAEESPELDSGSLSDEKPVSQSHLSTTDGQAVSMVSLGLPTPDEEITDLGALQLPLSIPAPSSGPCPIPPILDADHISNPVENSSNESSAAMNNIAAIVGGAGDAFEPISPESSLGTKESLETISSVVQSEEDVQLDSGTQVYYQSLLEMFFPDEGKFLGGFPTSSASHYGVANQPPKSY